MSPTLTSSSTRRVTIILTILPVLAACDHKEEKRMKALAGAYVSVSEGEIPRGEQLPWYSEEDTITLRADARWTRMHVARVRGQLEREPSADSGAYRVDGATVAFGATPSSPVMRFTISGDTLWGMTADSRRLAEAVTGVKPNGENVQIYWVRQR